MAVMDATDCVFLKYEGGRLTLGVSFTAVDPDQVVEEHYDTKQGESCLKRMKVRL
jgi:hypothetical protein